ncbi:hypothetical protein C1646_661403 [Rhizophagus diaphanus]|nr:hypothetical protein C1646_661403 [Rhizophagus diaphanus] [Rhizophagus sp. MUCL 43196]
MDKNPNCELYLPFQVSEDSNSIWPYRKNGESTRLLTDFTYNYVGRKVTSLDLSHSNHIQYIKGQRENYIPFRKAETARGNDNDDEIVRFALSLNCESNVSILPREHSEVYVQCFNLLRTSINTGENEKQQSLSDKVKSRRNANIAIGFSCSNLKTISELQASFGELCRVGTMGSVTWANELPRGMCHLVHAHPCLTQELRSTLDDQETVYQVSDRVENDVPQQGSDCVQMVVDTFANEQICRQVASTLGYELPIDSRDPKKLTCYMKQIAEFRFNHIIVIGEIDYGMVFMDCFGRVFHWEDMLQMLWPLGNYFSKKSNIRNKYAWFIENDGVVYETEPQCMYKKNILAICVLANLLNFILVYSRCIITKKQAQRIQKIISIYNI